MNHPFTSPDTLAFGAGQHGVAKNDAKIGARVYLDYSAMASIDPEVLAVMVLYFDRRFGNPSSLHENGRRAREAIESARVRIAECVGARPEEVIFTGSGTESDNLALIGTARANRARGNHIIISAVEHKAVTHSAHMLRAEGFEVTVLPVNRQGRIDVNECLRLITDKTILISLMYVNNELGTVEPVRELAKALRERRRDAFPMLHTDACQASNLFSLRVDELGVDLMTVNGSKIYGPTGIGFLYRRNGIALSPIIVGGEQEKNLRSGTENVPFIVGLSEALCRAQAGREAEYVRLAELRQYFTKELSARIPSLIVNGDPDAQSPSIVHVSIPFVEGESMLLRLDALGVSVSTGSACSAFDLRPSHVLLAIGQNPELIHGSIRFSLGKYTTKKELDYVLSVFPGIVSDLLSMSALRVRSPQKVTVSNQSSLT